MLSARGSTSPGGLRGGDGRHVGGNDAERGQIGVGVGDEVVYGADEFGIAGGFLESRKLVLLVESGWRR